MFPQAKVVRNAQIELDELIQKGVMKITRLLKNTEISQQLDIGTKLGNTGDKKTGSNDIIYDNGTTSDEAATGKVTNRLLKSGMISKTMLDQLKQEWLKEQGKLINTNEPKKQSLKSLFSESNSNDLKSNYKYSMRKNDRKGNSKKKGNPK